MGGDRQDQGIEPEEGTAGDTGKHPAAVGLFPVQRAEHGRCQLGHGGEGDLADGCQARGRAQQSVADVGQQENGDDADSAHREHPVTEHFERPLGVLPAQQPGQQHVIGDHGRQRDAGDNHHAGGRRSATDKGQQGQRRMGLGQRQADNVGVAQDIRGQHHAPGQGDRHHEQCREDQVGGEHPLGQAQVLGFDIFHHGDMELPGQADDRHHRHAGLHHHGWPVDRFLPVFGQQRRGFGLVEQIIETVIEAVGDEGADGEKGEQLDQGFEGNRQHHAAVVFGGVEVAGTEDDGEQRQDQRHHQGRVLGADAHGVGAGTDQQVDAEDDGFQLQGDIGQHADQADQRHHHRQGLRLAVAGGDEVGDGGDVFLFADQHHLLQDPGREHQQQHGAQVDRQERPELVGGLADRAEEGPTGAIDGQRQAVHPGPHARRQGRAAAVTIKGDGEHNGHIGQGDGGDQPAGQRHGNSRQKTSRGQSGPGATVSHDGRAASVSTKVAALLLRGSECQFDLPVQCVDTQRRVREQHPEHRRRDDQVEQALDAGQVFARVAIENGLQLSAENGRAIARAGAALHITHHLPARFRADFIQILLGPGPQVAAQAGGIGRFDLRAHTGKGHIRQQRRQVAPAPIDGRGRNPGPRRDLRDGQARAVLLFEKRADCLMNRFLHPGTAAARTYTFFDRHAKTLTQRICFKRKAVAHSAKAIF